MKRIPALLSALLATVALAPAALAQDLFLVQRDAPIFERADRNSTPLVQAKLGMIVRVQKGTPEQGFRKVLLDNGSGWIPGSVLKLLPGSSSLPTPLALPVRNATPATGTAPSTASANSRHLRVGTPQAFYVMVREGYAVCVDARLKIPAWVQYELRPEDLNGPIKRTDNWRPDTDITFAGARARTQDYERAGVDRGHMAPAEDMTTSQTRMDQSFLLSNAAPQNGTLNRGIWAQLEGAIREWIDKRKLPLVIIDGPIFSGADGKAVTYRQIGDGHVAEPTGFYKVVVDLSDAANPQALAFIFDNASPEGKSWPEFQKSVDEVEALTGLDLLSALPAATQKKIQSAKGPNWLGK